MKVVITRDDDGCLVFWPIRKFANLSKDNDGNWDCSATDLLLTIWYDCAELKGVCKLLGFTPRKGSKQVVDITVQRYYSTEIEKVKD